MGNVVIMGRKTAQSLPGGKPLPGRIHVVLSRSWEALPGFILCRDLSGLWQVLGELSQKNPKLSFWCIGGGEVYRQLLPYVCVAEITRLPGAYEADTWLPALTGFRLVSEQETQHCRFQRWLRNSRER